MTKKGKKNKIPLTIPTPRDIETRRERVYQEGLEKALRLVADQVLSCARVIRVDTLYITEVCEELSRSGWDSQVITGGAIKISPKEEK